MATAREIHRHMKSVGNIGKITKAMKMVAAARLRRAQERAAASRPYAIKIKEVLSKFDLSLAMRVENWPPPGLPEPSEEQRGLGRKAPALEAAGTAKSTSLLKAGDAETLDES